MRPKWIFFQGPTSFSMVSAATDLAPNSPNKPIYASHAEIDVLARSKFKLCISIHSKLIVPNFPMLEMHGVLLHECNATRVEGIRGDCISYSFQLALISSLLGVISRI